MVGAEIGVSWVTGSLLIGLAVCGVGGCRVRKKMRD